MQNNIRREIAVISSDYINGISIWNSLKKLNFTGEVIFLNTSGRNMVGSIWPGATVYDFVKKDPIEIIPFLEKLDTAATKYLFLTSELFHGVLHQHRDQLHSMNVIAYFGNSDPYLILDKEKFLSHLSKVTSVPVPESYGLNDKMKFPLMMKFRRSFSGEERAPKPIVINSIEELNKNLQGLNVDDLQLQELLSSEDLDNVSICGWYDEEKQVLFQTRKVIQHPPKIGNGDVVELLPLDPVLAEHAKQVCKAVQFNGPFELEFIKERNGNRYKVIEMNPRFWMQHGLVEELSGHYLVAKYIGKEPIAPVKDLKYWIYPMVSIYKTMLMNFKYLPYLTKSKVHWPVNGASATKFLFKHLLSKI